MQKIRGVMTTVWQNEEQLSHLRRVAEHFERLNNIQTSVYSDKAFENLEIVHPAFARYHLWQLVPKDVDRVIYVDTDVVPLRPLPEPPDADFCLSPDQTQLFEKLAERCPAVKRAGMYYNSGVFVANRNTERLFARMIGTQSHMLEKSWPWFYDQTMLNIQTQLMVEDGELTFAPLSKMWNNIVMVDGEFVANPYMIHMAGLADLKLRGSRAIIDTFEWIETLVRSQQTLRAKDGKPADR